MVVFGQWIDILDWPYGQIRPIFGPDNGLLKLNKKFDPFSVNTLLRFLRFMDKGLIVPDVLVRESNQSGP
jgi:hypothetical protein